MSELLGCVQGGRGSSACRAEGTGELRDVRIINLHHDTLFWFKVDSKVPGHIWHSMPWAAASYRRAQSREPDSTPVPKQVMSTINTHRTSAT